MTPGNPIATEEAPEEARQRMTTVAYVGKQLRLASQVPMDLSGMAVANEQRRRSPVVP